MVDVKTDVFLGEKKRKDALNKCCSSIALTKSDTDGKAYGLELFLHRSPQK